MNGSFIYLYPGAYIYAHILRSSYRSPLFRRKRNWPLSRLWLLHCSFCGGGKSWAFLPTGAWYIYHLSIVPIRGKSALASLKGWAFLEWVSKCTQLPTNNQVQVTYFFGVGLEEGISYVSLNLNCMIYSIVVFSSSMVYTRFILHFEFQVVWTPVKGFKVTLASTRYVLCSPGLIPSEKSFNQSSC